MDAQTYSTLSILVSGLVEDPHLYDQVIQIAIKPQDPPELQKLAQTYKIAFDKLFENAPRPRRVTTKQADAYVAEAADILEEMTEAGGEDSQTAEWGRRSLLWTQKQIHRDEQRVQALRELR